MKAVIKLEPITFWWIVNVVLLVVGIVGFGRDHDRHLENYQEVFVDSGRSGNWRVYVGRHVTLVALHGLAGLAFGEDE